MHACCFRMPCACSSFRLNVFITWVGRIPFRSGLRSTVMMFASGLTRRMDSEIIWQPQCISTHCFTFASSSKSNSRNRDKISETVVGYQPTTPWFWFHILVTVPLMMPGCKFSQICLNLCTSVPSKRFSLRNAFCVAVLLLRHSAYPGSPFESFRFGLIEVCCRTLVNSLQ